MNQPVILGLSGKKGSGKDTLFTCLKEIEPRAVRLAFADPLKEEVAAGLGVHVDFIDEHKDHFRLVLQGWGTDIRRQLFGQDYWIERLRERLAVLKAIQPPLIVITDVRFPNEFDFVKANNGLNVRVIRCESPSDGHTSENALDGHKFDYCVHNTGPLCELPEHARALLSHVMPRRAI